MHDAEVLILKAFRLNFLLNGQYIRNDIVLTLGELVSRHAKAKPNREAYVDQDRRVNWRQLHERTDQLGHALREKGVSPGDRIGIVSSDCIEVAETFIACAKIGATRVGMSGRLAPREIAHLIDDAGITVLFVQSKYAARVTDALSQARSKPSVISIGSSLEFPVDYESLMDGVSADKPLEQTPHERLMICYTTGSTGLPKGAVYPHGTFVQSLIAIALAEGANHDDVWLHAMPAAGVPVMHLVRNLFHGSKCAIVGEWSAEAALQMIERERATITVLVPTMLTSLIDSGLLTKYDTSSLRQLGYGAAPIPPAAMRDAVRALGCNLLQMYGSTELMGMSMMLYPSDHEVGLKGNPDILSSAGRPLSYVSVKVVNEEGDELPAGETGELLISGDFIIPEYWNNEEQYRQTVVNGWLHTGDMARIDDAGYIYLGDRAKFRIKTGGYNVFPTEVENVLAEHPSVLEVGVVGLPDKVWGEKVHAVVKLKQGAAATPTELRDFCRGKIADFRVPKSVDIWEEIPKGVTGKIQKREIIDFYVKKP